MAACVTAAGCAAGGVPELTSDEPADVLGSRADIAGHPAEHEIRALSERGIVAGFPDGSFRPNAPVTRAQLAALLANAFAERTPVTTEVPRFTDAIPSWAQNAVTRAYQLGFLRGYPDGTFRADAQVSRLEVLVALANGAGLGGGDPNELSAHLRDASSVPSWARQSIANAIAGKVLTNQSLLGNDRRTLSPSTPATRGDVASFLFFTLFHQASWGHAMPGDYALAAGTGQVSLTCTGGELFASRSALASVGLEGAYDLAAIRPERGQRGTTLASIGSTLSLTGDTSPQCFARVAHFADAAASVGQASLARGVRSALYEHYTGSSCRVGRQFASQADDSDLASVHLIYAVASDGVDGRRDLDDSLLASVSVMNDWLRRQTGRSTRLDSCAGTPELTFVKLPSTKASLRSAGPFARDRIQADLKSLGFADPNRIYLVFYDGETLDASCANAAWPPSGINNVTAVYLKGQFSNPAVPPCAQNPLAKRGQNPGYMEFATLHEVFHMMGAVPDCAPHTVGSHVGDDPTDLMYAGSQPWQPSAIDVGRDDYFGHNRAGCYNAAQNPFFDPLPAPAAMPPGW